MAVVLVTGALMAAMFAQSWVLNRAMRLAREQARTLAAFRTESDRLVKRNDLLTAENEALTMTVRALIRTAVERKQQRQGKQPAQSAYLN